jgi:hypothetical protein
MVYANDFFGNTDSDILNAAIKGRDEDGIVIIGARKAVGGSDRKWWSLDTAILLPSNTTVILQNCKLKLSDKCRDNFFRSANCGFGIEENEPIFNVHIKGEGNVVLEGADHPRATGDASKTLKKTCPFTVEDICRHADWVEAERRTPEQITFADRHDYSYGTDAGREGEVQNGDWRGIGILFARVNDFSISGLTVRESHGWAISLEDCSNGYVEKIHFDARMNKMIDGMLQNMENQDGVDLRNGCHDITISDITGETGDDVVALTAIASSKYRPGGALGYTQVMHNDWSRRDPDIYNIIIRNVRAYSSLCYLVRLLPCECSIRNVVIDGVIDTSPEDVHCGCLFLGERDAAYGRNLPGSLRNITISNVIYNNTDEAAIRVDGYLQDSTVTNVIATRTNYPIISVLREGGLKNVMISNIVHGEGTQAVEKM